MYPALFGYTLGCVFLSTFLLAGYLGLVVNEFMERRTWAKARETLARPARHE